MLKKANAVRYNFDRKKWLIFVGVQFKLFPFNKNETITSISLRFSADSCPSFSAKELIPADFLSPINI